MIARLGGFDPVALSSQIGLLDLDRVQVKRAPRWLVKAWRRNVGAMTLPWGIYVRRDLLAGEPAVLAQLIRHELVHVRQWQEIGLWRFLFRYLAEYLRHRRRGLGHQRAYEEISFEREARQLAM